MPNTIEHSPHLAALLDRHGEAIALTWARQVQALPGSRYGQLPFEALLESGRRGVQAMRAAAASGAAGPLEEEQAHISRERLRLDFDIGEVVEAILLYGEVIPAFAANDFPPGTPEREHILAQLMSQLRYAASGFSHIYASVIQQQKQRLAILEERQRLARDLHDSVAQALYTVTLYADAAGLALDGPQPVSAVNHLRELRGVAQEALRDLRLLIFELRPAELEKNGLVAALQSRLEAVEARAGLAARLHVSGEERLTFMFEEALYRIAQEALNNVVKHAAARQVEVSLAFDPATVQLEVSDDGVGLDPTAATGGLGLRGIRERAHALGGQVVLESAPGQGTRLRVLAPRPAPAPEAAHA